MSASGYQSDFVIRPNRPHACLFVGFACAATTSALPAVLEEVVATAQRREQNVQNIPVAVSAFSESDMDTRQITEALDLVRQVPNLVGHNNTGPGNSNAYFLRGLGNTESIATFDPPVGTYIDDVYVSRQSANNNALHDVERVEVLRGPQGTLFGRNTTGGAVNIVTKKPSERFAAKFEGAYGEFDKIMARASVDLPASATVLTKFSAYYEEQDGFVRSTLTGELNNDLETYGARIALRVLPTDKTVWDLAAEYAFNDQLNLTRRCIEDNLACAQGVIASENRTGLSSDHGGGSLLEQARRGEGLGSETMTTFVVSNLSFDFGSHSIAFITGYREESWDYIIDFLPTGLPALSGFAIANAQDTEQFTQEIKVNGTLLSDRLGYTAGVFYIDETNETDFQDLAGDALLIDRVMRNGTVSTAAYLQLEYSLTDRLALTLGGRYTDEKKRIAYRSRLDRGALFDISTSELIAGGVPVEQQVGRFTPKIAIEYQATADWLWYASATNGFKSGGWNARGAAPHVAASYLPFGPEEVWSYEGGFKSQLFDDTMRLNADAFWAEVGDLQLISGVANPAGGVLFLTQNSGAARFRGAEFEWQWLPTDTLSLFANVGLIDARYISIRAQPVQSIFVETHPERTPDITGSLGFLYTVPSAALAGQIRLGADAAYTGVHWVSAGNTPPFSHVDSRWLYQAQIGYVTESGRWSATLSCKNCSDEEYVTSWFIGPYMGDPMTWDLRLTLRY
jgi:iron complex outermembrane receptor protein